MWHTSCIISSSSFFLSWIHSSSFPREGAYSVPFVPCMPVVALSIFFLPCLSWLSDLLDHPIDAQCVCLLHLLEVCLSNSLCLVWRYKLGLITRARDLTLSIWCFAGVLDTMLQLLLLIEQKTPHNKVGELSSGQGSTCITFYLTTKERKWRDLCNNIFNVWKLKDKCAFFVGREERPFITKKDTTALCVFKSSGIGVTWLEIASEC